MHPSSNSLLHYFSIFIPWCGCATAIVASPLAWHVSVFVFFHEFFIMCSDTDAIYSLYRKKRHLTIHFYIAIKSYRVQSKTLIVPCTAGENSKDLVINTRWLWHDAERMMPRVNLFSVQTSMYYGLYIPIYYTKNGRRDVLVIATPMKKRC